MQANQKSEVLVALLSERFDIVAEGAAGDAGTPAGGGHGHVVAAAAEQQEQEQHTQEQPQEEQQDAGLSPVGDAEYYSDGEEATEVQQQAAHRMLSMPARSPLPGPLEGAVNPLFYLTGGTEQTGGSQEQQRQPQWTVGAASTAAAAPSQRGSLGGRPGASNSPAALALSAQQPAGQPMASSKRKAEEGAPEESPLPAAKRQACEAGWGGAGAPAGSSGGCGCSSGHHRRACREAVHLPG